MVNFYCDIDMPKQRKTKKLFSKIFTTTNNMLKLDNERMVDVTIVSEEEIKRINKDYRQKDAITDVISFAFDEAQEQTVSPMIGEIYICYNRAIQQAQEYGHSLKRELCFLFCHGLLHLYGYDHMQEDEAQEMFKLQDIILDKCKIYRER